MLLINLGNFSEQKLQTVQHENGILKREKDQLGIDIEEWKTIHRKQ